MEDILNQSLSQIVTDNYQSARIFEDYGLDFCCKGKRSLRFACVEKQIDLDAILEDLTAVFKPENSKSDFNEMSLTELSEYVVRVHHTYVKLNMPQIYHYILKVTSKHQEQFPYMIEVSRLFDELRKDFEEHMDNEEKNLFPKIRLLSHDISKSSDAEFLRTDIDELELEHDKAGTIMQKIRTLTNNYTAPAGVCTTFHLMLDSLKAFEEDLHHHVHLENNILFPKALLLIPAPVACSCSLH